MPVERFRVWRGLTAAAPAPVLLALCLLLFLSIVAFGEAPRALGLDAAWTEVLAWGFLRHAQWGQDLVFTYGPLGFLQPYTSYVDGMFPWYVAGQILLPAGFALSVGLLLRGRSLMLLLLVAAASACSLPALPGDLSWAFTLLFGSAWLLRPAPARFSLAASAATAMLVVLFAVIALTKFSLLPLWAACVLAIAGVDFLAGRRRRSLVLGSSFLLAFVGLWCACGQDPRNLPLFLSTGFEVASGFGHAMGNRAPLPIEMIAVAMLTGLLGACATLAWTNRGKRAAVALVALIAASAVLFWLAFLTRGDHWPLFCPAISLLPLPLLADRTLILSSRLRAALVALIACAACIGPQAGTIVDEAALRLGRAVYHLGHLRQLAELRREQWHEVGRAAALPKIVARIGAARVDMVTSEPGLVLLNGLNYAPRPVFQSYSAYTPRLARLNEAHFTGAGAPDFVLFQLAYIDGRVPTIEDALALIALLRRYRPVISEQGFLLLQRDASTPVPALVEENKPLPARLHRLIEVPGNDGKPALAFLHVELSAFGKLYTLLFREPNLYLTRRTASGEAIRQRLVRATAASGFLISPVIGSNDDWIRLYLSQPLREVVNLAIDTDSKWERLIFRRKIHVSFQPFAPLRANPRTPIGDLDASLPYPGFSHLPVDASTESRTVVEDGEPLLFLQAPASLRFEPAPGHYRIRATFGLERAALADPGCRAAHPDGIGIAVVLVHDGGETVLARSALDPFRAAADAGPHQFALDDVALAAGDSVAYRVDPGGAANLACDWSYVRDLTFEPVEPAPDRRPQLPSGDAPTTPR